jgi:hypothetical protein
MIPSRFGAIKASTAMTAVELAMTATEPRMKLRADTPHMNGLMPALIVV